MPNGWGIGWMEWIFALVPIALIIAFWALVIMLVAKLVKSRPSNSSVPARSSALAVLEERYARGEITREEFLERKTVLSSRPPGGVV